MKPWLIPSCRTRIVNGFVMIALAGGGFAIGCAVAAQPHMYNALGALQNARNELAVAEHNKGGHRDIAITRVDEAIHQVRLGIVAGGG